MISCVAQKLWALQITVRHHVGAGNGTGHLPEQQVFLACWAIFSGLNYSSLETFSGDLEVSICGRHCHPHKAFLPSGFCGCWIHSRSHTQPQVGKGSESSTSLPKERAQVVEYLHNTKSGTPSWSGINHPSVDQKFKVIPLHREFEAILGFMIFHLFACLIVLK